MKNLIFKICSVTILLTIPKFAFSAKAKMHPGFYDDLAIYLVGGAGLLVIFTSLFVLYRLLNSVVRIGEVEEQRKLGLDPSTIEKPSWWKRFSRSVSNAVPLEKEDEILLNHNYDGIQELDNNLPSWWVYGFYSTIVIAIFYMGFYHFSSYAQSSHDEYALEMKVAKEGIERYLAQQANSVDETNVIALFDPNDLAAGKDIFNANCSACHMASGGGAPGSVGPNLTDEYWLHGGGIKNIFKTVKHGVPDKGMIAWKTQMRPADIHKVSSYILSLQGTNPPNAKEPQGELWKAENVIEKDTIQQPLGMN